MPKDDSQLEAHSSQQQAGRNRVQSYKALHTNAALFIDHTNMSQRRDNIRDMCDSLHRKAEHENKVVGMTEGFVLKS